MTFTLFLLVNERPDDKYLNTYVTDKVCTVWRELGVQLLEQKDVHVLERIKIDNSNSVKHCCMEMFTEWRQRTPKASWKQLIGALKNINLNHLANELEGLLISPREFYVGQESEMSLTSPQQQKPSQESEGS